MSFIVYEKSSTLRIDNINGFAGKKQSFATMASAKAARTQFLKKQMVYTADDILIAESKEFYATIEQDRIVKSAMDGSPVTIKANTPWCCNPASETYWSM